MPEITLRVNGRPVSGAVEGRTLLVEFLRTSLGLTGVHVGCDTSQCGACVVLIDGRSVKACSLLAVQADGTAVTTIEGLAGEGLAGEGLAGETGALHPMQQAFHEHHALQCGFCTPGMILSSLDLLQHHPAPDEATIRAWLTGNLCRCTGYQGIVDAIQAGAAATSTGERKSAPLY